MLGSSKEGGGLLASIGLKKEDIKVNEDDSIADDESLGDLHKKSDLFDKSKDKKEDGLKKEAADSPAATTFEGPVADQAEKWLANKKRSIDELES